MTIIGTHFTLFTPKRLPSLEVRLNEAGRLAIWLDGVLINCDGGAAILDVNPDLKWSGQDPRWCYLCDRPKNDCACDVWPAVAR